MASSDSIASSIYLMDHIFMSENELITEANLREPFGETKRYQCHNSRRRSRATILRVSTRKKKRREKEYFSRPRNRIQLFKSVKRQKSPKLE